MHLTTSPLPEGWKAPVEWPESQRFPPRCLNFLIRVEKHISLGKTCAAIEDYPVQAVERAVIHECCYILGHPSNIRIESGPYVRRASDTAASDERTLIQIPKLDARGKPGRPL
jgi:hypothetical protein